MKGITKIAAVFALLAVLAGGFLVASYTASADVADGVTGEQDEGYAYCGGIEGCRATCGCGCGGNPDLCGCGR